MTPWASYLTSLEPGFHICNMGDNNTYLTGVVWKIRQDSACKVSNGIWHKVGTSLSQHRDKGRKEGGGRVGSVTHSLGD